MITEHFLLMGKSEISMLKFLAILGNGYGKMIKRWNFSLKVIPGKCIMLHLKTFNYRFELHAFWLSGTFLLSF